MAEEQDIVDIMAEAPAGASADSSTPAPASTPPEASTPPPSTPATPVAPVAAAAPAAPAAPGYESARDFLAKRLGRQTSSYADDESYLMAWDAETQTLRRQLDEAKQLAQLGHLYLQQQQPKPPAADKPDPFARYKAPEFDQAWLSQVERTPEGELRLRPGGDPAIIPKLHAYQRHQAEVAQKMTADPIGYLKEAVETIAAEKAQSLFQEQFQRIQAEQNANTFLRENASWMLQQDSQGRFVHNPATGQPMLTPPAERYLQYMQQAEKGGANQAFQQEYAAACLYRDMNTPAAQGAQAVDVGEKQKQALLAANNRNRSGSMTPPESGGPPVQNQALSLKERLLQLPDEVFAPMAASA